jgi:hypothetical protein
MFFLRARTVSAETRRRGVALLLHSTHLYRNFARILEDGCLHTARTLGEVHGETAAARFLHDPRRYEQFAVGRDYLNASLSVPNFELLYHRSKADWKAEWVHFALPLILLDKADTLFCPVSAATERGRHLQKGIAGFRALFASEVDGHARAGLPNHVPTHPQAEVLIKGPLTLTQVVEVLVPNVEVATEVQRLSERFHRELRVEIAPQLFVWPKWLMESS